MTVTRSASKNHHNPMPNFDFVKPFFTKFRSFLSKLFPRRTEAVVSFDTYLKMAENIKQKIQQDYLKSKMIAYNGSYMK